MKKLVTLALICTILLCGCTIETAEQYRERIGEASYETIESPANSPTQSADSHSPDSQSDDSQATPSTIIGDGTTGAPATTTTGSNKPSAASPNGQSEDSQSKDSTAAVPPATSPPVIEVCVLSVDCSTILDNMSSLKKGKEELVGDGTLFPAASIPYVEGDTVFDLTLRALGSQLDYTSLKYVRGIKQIYEKNCGSQSGWIYFVNGQKLGVSSAACVLKPGDIVEWKFTCNGGNDLN